MEWERYSVTCKDVTQGPSGGESSHGCLAVEALKCCFVSAPRGLHISPVGLDILAKVRIAYVRAECDVVRHHVLRCLLLHRQESAHPTPENLSQSLATTFPRPLQN